MPGNTYNLTKRTELAELVSEKKPVIIKFTATWCGPCKRIAPTFNRLVEKVKHLVDIVIVDADEGCDICSSLKVRGYPSFLSYINGEMAESMIGADDDELLAFFKATISRLI
tara:strand:+ start:2015 stop:2350 length:336 start_codon:yes stop_codon:yes gene_type:complete